MLICFGLPILCLDSTILFGSCLGKYAAFAKPTIWVFGVFFCAWCRLRYLLRVGHLHYHYHHRRHRRDRLFANKKVFINYSDLNRAGEPPNEILPGLQGRSPQLLLLF